MGIVVTPNTILKQELRIENCSACDGTGIQPGEVYQKPETLDAAYERKPCVFCCSSGRVIITTEERPYVKENIPEWWLAQKKWDQEKNKGN